MGLKNMSRKKKILWSVILVLAVNQFLNYWPVKIEISRETTFIDGPVNEDGTVNYAAAVDESYSAGVTPENNAALILVQALGGSILQEGHEYEVLDRIGFPLEQYDPEGLFTTWDERVQVEELAEPTTQQAGPAKPENASLDEMMGLLPDGEIDPNFLEELLKQGIEEPAEEVSIDDVTEMLLDGQVHPDLEAWLEQNAEA
ncbi:unnamed protein product, partial [marine sediment metagenome]